MWFLVYRMFHWIENKQTWKILGVDGESWLASDAFIAPLNALLLLFVMVMSSIVSTRVITLPPRSNCMVIYLTDSKVINEDLAMESMGHDTCTVLFLAQRLYSKVHWGDLDTNEDFQQGTIFELERVGDGNSVYDTPKSMAFWRVWGEQPRLGKQFSHWHRSACSTAANRWVQCYSNRCLHYGHEASCQRDGRYRYRNDQGSVDSAN